jgi:hypothetical protein
LSLSLLWTILFYGWTASEIIIAVATRTRRSGGKVRDRGSMLVMWAAIIPAITAAEFICHMTFARIMIGAYWLMLAAIVVIAAGVSAPLDGDSLPGKGLQRQRGDSTRADDLSIRAVSLSPSPVLHRLVAGVCGYRAARAELAGSRGGSAAHDRRRAL